VLLAELEPGDELFIILEGSAQISVRSSAGDAVPIARLGPGDACGEISLVTRQLRSATATASEDLVALRLSQRVFDDLLERHPTVAVHFARAVAMRVREVKAEVRKLAEQAKTEPSNSLAGRSPAVIGGRWSARRAWREAVTGRRGLPILALGSFLGVLGGLRLGGWLLESNGLDMFGYLRAGYTIGFAILILSTAASLLRFRAVWQRVIAVAFGAAFAMVGNGLSVFLAFDVFYLDMTTRDPSLIFDVHSLYHRNESAWAILVAALLLLLVVLLGGTWRRIALLIRARIQRA
jgi:hypothetical protein